MDVLIDSLFNSIYTILLFWCILQGLGYLLFKFWDTINYEKFRIFIAIFLPTIIFLTMFFIYLIGNYGFVEKIVDIKIVDEKICLLDEKIRNSKFDGKRKVCRLYVLSLDNGQKLNRKMIGLNAKIQKIMGHNIIFAKKWFIKKGTVEINELYMYNVNTNLFTTDSLSIANLIESNAEASDTTQPPFNLILTGNNLMYSDIVWNIKWKTDLSEFKLPKNYKIENRAIYKQKLIFNVENHVFCINATNGNLIWEKEY